ncbi:hypothetical protein RND81_O082000 [Saponaria officinalis]|uniref:Maturase MatK N-terminal domain-containing protein n=1 Tax=Saponaria officinalis TaxID=3572 RepID=A0AAW1GGB1_SAPOF
MDEFQRYIELEGSWQHNFSYPLIFQEYMFSFAYGHGLTKSIFLAISCDRKYSLLIVKRLITRMYQQNHLILSAKNSNQNDFLGHKHNFYSQMISEGFSVIVEIPFSLLLIASPEREKIVKSHNLRSIHSIFPFLEGQILTFKLCVRYINTLPHPSRNLGSNTSVLGERCLVFAFITILS